MRNLPPLNALRAFEAAGRHESFNAAAEELGVTHSSVSRHVRGLEDRLGVQLFASLPRGVRLTQSGAAYLDEIAPAFDRIEDATRNLGARAEGVLTVSCEPLFATLWLIARLHAFQEIAPEVEVQLDPDHALADVRRHEADFAIRFYKSGVPDRPTDLISDLPLHVYSSPAFAATLQTPEDLLRVPRLQDRDGDMWAHWFAEAGVDTQGIETRPAWRMRAVLACHAALAGRGAILVGDDVVQGYVESGQLVRVFDIGFQLGSYHLLMGEGARQDKAARAFRAWLLEATRDLRVGTIKRKGE
ncbi:LysR substrate-binding domain-containing protein [Pseudaestuariivita sp.]|uniref:LysR substrate-binding domain-containing protein n=1 Tax=Pseudaestuariivita sp. TaxID=2211669 RepID=UPI004059679A